MSVNASGIELYSDTLTNSAFATSSGGPRGCSVGSHLALSALRIAHDCMCVGASSFLGFCAPVLTGRKQSLQQPLGFAAVVQRVQDIDCVLEIWSCLCIYAAHRRMRIRGAS